MTKGCVYRLTNTVNGKKYIGKTIHFTTRMYYHATKHTKCHYLHNAIKKYGWNKFKREIIIDDVPEKDLSNIEMSYIDVENTLAPNGYNLTRGGEGCSGMTHSEETKRKLSIMNTGKKHPQFGKHRSKSTREKISIARRNKRVGSVTKKGRKWATYGPRWLGYKYLGLYPTKEAGRAAVKKYMESYDN